MFNDVFASSSPNTNWCHFTDAEKLIKTNATTLKNSASEKNITLKDFIIFCIGGDGNDEIFGALLIPEIREFNLKELRKRRKPGFA
jgi:hypothetical protein